MQLLTVGHGTLDAAPFAALVRAAGVEIVVDVRRFPGSRRYPHFAREAMAQWLPQAGVTYMWVQSLGGRRLTRKDSVHTGLRNDAFRGYADYMTAPEFSAAFGALLVQAAESRVAIMCSESLWWRCHRRLIADAAVLLHGVEVSHLMHNGSHAAHAVTAEAAVQAGHLVYRPAGETQPPLL